MKKFQQLKDNQSLINCLAFATAYALTAGFIKTGLVSLFYYILIICALASFVFTIFQSDEKSPLYTKNFLLYFFSLYIFFICSMFWSSASEIETMKGLYEYRFFPLTWLICWYFHKMLLGRFVIMGILSGVLTSVVASILLNLGWMELDGAVRSLSNRIYFGFLVNIGYLTIVFYLVLKDRLSTSVMLGVSAVQFLILFFLEDGRSGQITSIALFAVVSGWQFFNRNASSNPQHRFLFISSFSVFLLSTMYLFAFIDFGRYDGALIDSFVGLKGSLGQRAAMYLAGIDFVTQSWLLGSGVGTIDGIGMKLYESGELLFLTDNFHSEILNILLQAGVVGLFLLTLFIYSFKVIAFNSRAFQTLFVLCLCMLFLTHGLFNSMLRDFGDKHLLSIFIGAWVSLGVSSSLGQRDVCS